MPPADRVDRPTALLLPVLTLRGLLRRFHSQLNAAPPHVTVLFPFLPHGAIDRGTLDTLRTLFAQFERLRVSFGDVRWFNRRVVWLAPTPPEPFVEMTNALTARFPQCKPYDGQFDDIIPHLALVEDRPKPVMWLAELLGRSALPIDVDLREVWLMVLDHRGRWQVSHTFPLG